VVDLGCGSGRWARELNRSGYEVYGVDQSPAMIRLARGIAPDSRFKIASLWTCDLPPCDAITSIGECLNYRFDCESDKHAIFRLFKRLHDALRPGGVFICDFAGLGCRPRQGGREHRSFGSDWAVTATSTVRGPNGIGRRIVAFRQVGKKRRRSDEVHELRLYPTRDICSALRRCGFRVRTVKAYGGFRLPRGIHGVVATKAKTSSA
jgi:SAM-dependent methyltransferase